MTIKDFKKLGRLLKTIYQELEREAINEGIDLMSPEYDELVAKAREKVLANAGFTLEEYREAKAKVLLVPEEEAKMLGLIEESEKNINLRMKKIEGFIEETHVPTFDEITNIAEQISQKYIVPPQITNEVVEVIKQPITERVEYDDTLINEKLGRALQQLDEIKIQEPIDVGKLKEELKSDFSVFFDKNIDILGMPNFRKLALGLRQDIDNLQTSVDNINPTTTLADVSTNSTTAAQSLYTMTSTIPVEFRSSDGNTILYIDETNEYIRATKLVGSTSTTGDLTLQTTSGVGASGADMHFLVGNNGATEAMTILNNGNVGIGTTGPSQLLTLGSTGALAWDNGSGTADTMLRRQGANIIAQRNGTTAQEWQLYHTYTDASNYERVRILWSSNRAYIITGAAGTGTNRDLVLGDSESGRWYIGGTVGHFLAEVDNTYDIGASGATRPRTGYFGTSVVAPNFTGVASSATILATARTIGGVSFDGSANITVASATGGFTVSGGNLALGTNSLTMTGSLAATGARVTKGWFTDIESTNMPTVGGTSLTTVAQTFQNKTITNSNNVLGGVTMTLGSDADGDIYYRASNVLTRLAKGTADQVLTMNAGATAPEWADAAGGGASCLTYIPRPAMFGLNDPSTAAFGMVTNTEAHLGQVVVPFSMVVNKLTVRSGTVTTAGVFDIVLYSEDGQTQVISVTTASINASDTLFTTAVSSVSLSAGIYYVLVVPNGTMNVELLAWSLEPAAPFSQTQGIHEDVTSEPIMKGLLTVTAGTPPATFDPTAITSTATNDIIIIRLDN